MNMNKMTLADRMKEFYENRTRVFLPRRNYTLIRIDGKAFHTFTKGLIKPFDDTLINHMDLTAAYLCKNIMGAKFAYVQSDEISILITDFDTFDTQAWFDYNIQKMCSVSASMATRRFNELRMYEYFTLPSSESNIVPKKSSIKNIGEHFTPGTNLEDVSDDIASFINYMPLNGFKLAEFDSRVWQISSKNEVFNYFLWRQQDCVRNSIQSVAQSLFSQKELNGKHVDNLIEMMISEKETNWNDFAPKYKHGRLIIKEQYNLGTDGNNALRTRWVSKEIPLLSENKESIMDLIPNLN